MTQTIKAPTGSELTCKNWLIEAAYRMIQNNLDAEVAFDPDNLIVYGGRGRAARNWQCYDAILQSLKELNEDETLLVQSGKPVGVFRSHADAPRVLIANSNIVPHWATQEQFDQYERDGLMMYGQMTAGSWIYIGTQGILQGTYETFGSLARQHGWGDLSGKLVLTAGLGEMGGAQAQAITFNGGVGLLVEVDPWRIERRLALKQVDVAAKDLDEALALAGQAIENKEPRSIALCGNAAEVHWEIIERGLVPDVVTDQTSAHDVLYGYIPTGLTLAEAEELRKSDQTGYGQRAMDSMARHVTAMLEFKKRGSVVFDYGNNLRQRAKDNGVENAFDYPGFVPAYIRPLFCEGKGPFRWVALSGDKNDIYKTDEAMMNLFPENDHLARWLTMAQEQVEFQGLPARICWLGYGDRAKAGLKLNEMVASGELKAPIVIGRDHLDCGSVASPNRETEAMKDGSDAIADWVYLNAMINVAGGATWVSLHHGGGVGIGYSLHAGQVIVADGTPEAARRIERVLTTDPGMGIIRHADAGYDEAIEFAARNDVKVPMSHNPLAWRPPGKTCTHDMKHFPTDYIANNAALLAISLVLILSAIGCKYFGSSGESNSNSANNRPAANENRTTAALDTPERSFPIDADIFAADLSSDGKTIVTRGSREAKVWDTAGGKQIATLTGHTSVLIDATISPDGKMIATAGDDGVKLWNASDGTLTKSLTSPGHGPHTIAISPKGDLVASSDLDNDKIYIWELPSGRLQRMVAGSKMQPKSLDFSSDGKKLAVGGLLNTFSIWDTTTGENLRRVELPVKAIDVTVAFSPDDATLATGSQDHLVRLWDASTGAEKLALKGHTSTVRALAFSRDGRTLASGGNDKLVMLWNTADGKALRTIRGHSSYVDSVIFAPDGKTLVTASGLDKTVKFWRID